MKIKKFNEDLDNNKYWSKNKEELKDIIATKKYNL